MFILPDNNKKTSSNIPKSINFDQPTLDSLDQICQKERKSRSEICRIAINQLFVAYNKKEQEDSCSL